MFEDLDLKIADEAPTQYAWGPNKTNNTCFCTLACTGLCHTHITCNTCPCTVGCTLAAC